MREIFYPKLLSIIRAGISRDQIARDILSGTIVAVVALPLAIAFAIASGVSPEKGLITAIVAGFIISLLGGSRVQIGGPTGAFIVVVVGIIEEYGFEGMLISTMLAGVVLVVFGVLKLGNLLKYIPQPMVVGFTSGIALIIFTTQVKDFLGISATNIPSEFIGKWGFYIQNITNFNYHSIIIAGISILVVVFSKRLIPIIPGSLLAILLSTFYVLLFKIPVDTIGSVFGEIPKAIHLNVPTFQFHELVNYISPAITIALLGGIESLLSATVSDGMISGNHRSNTELIAQGIANIVTPFFGGIPATGAIARTATNVKNGGRTPISGIVHAIGLLLIMVLFGKWAKLIPMPCLAGILIVVAYNMSEWRSFISIFKNSRFDIIILLSTFFLTVFYDLTIAIELGVVLSAILFMKRMADNGISVEEQIDSDLIGDYKDIPAQIAIYEISGPFFFATAKRYAEAITELGAKSELIIIRMRHVPFVDSTGCSNLKVVISMLRSKNTKIILSGVNKDVLKELKYNSIVDLVGKENIKADFKEAIGLAKKRIGQNRINPSHLSS